MLACARNLCSCLCFLRPTGRQGRGPPSSNQVYRHGQETSGDDAVWGRVAVGACPQCCCTNRHQCSEEWRRGEGACTERDDDDVLSYAKRGNTHSTPAYLPVPGGCIQSCPHAFYREYITLKVFVVIQNARDRLNEGANPCLLSCIMFAQLNQVIMVCISDGRANVPLSVSNGEPVSCCAE